MEEVKAGTWRDVAKNAATYDEQRIKEMINNELAGANRKSVIVRLHQSYCKMRMLRERTLLSIGLRIE